MQNGILYFLLVSSYLVIGDTLTELAETTDTNAVLVLQPAVESFFLVHGTEKDEKPSTAEEKEKPNDTSRDTLQSSSSFDVPPSPGPYSPGSSASPSSSRNQLQNSSYSHLPADTQKFLRFAGMSCETKCLSFQ